MKKTKRRILSIVLTLVMIVGMIPLGTMTSFAEGPQKIGTSDVTWELTDSNTVLTLGGTGAMPDFTVDISTNDIPWYSAKDTITTVKVGSGITRFGNNAFKGCDNIANLYIEDPKSWCKIEFGNAYSCPFQDGTHSNNLYVNGNPATDLVIPDTITEIKGYAFTYFNKLTSVTIPSSVTSIGDRAFGGCTGLTSITIPSSVTSIGDGAFGFCEGLTSVTIPASVTSIGQSAFECCEGLTSVTISSGVTTIEQRAFADCPKLVSVTIPSSVTEIGNTVFGKSESDTAGCAALTSVTVKATTPPTLGIGAFPTSNANFKGYVPFGTLTDYQNAARWKLLKAYLAEAYVVDDKPTANGTVAMSKDCFPTDTYTAANETVTVTVTPDAGYALKSLKYNDGTDHDITSAKSFTMPLANVIITAEFEEAETGGTTATFNPKDHWTEYCSPLGSKTFGSSNEVTATFSNGFQYDGWGKIAIGDPDYITASVTISVPAGSVISKVAFNYLSTHREVGVFTSTVGSMSETVTEPFGSNEWTGSANSVTFTPTGAMTIASFEVTYTSSQGTSHTHKASENYMANASAHWFACSGDDCSLKGKTDAETLANYEAAFADKDTGEALKTTLGYTAHSGMGDFKCDVCNYEDVAGAIESIKTELGVAKSRALCDEARAAFDTAIENVGKATTLEGVNNARKTGIDNAVKADMLFSQSVIEAKTRLGKLKGEVKSDKAKAEIDTAIENVEKATNLENVEKALREGFDSANEVEGKFNSIVKAAKAQLEEVKKNLKSDKAKAEIDTAIENVEKATNPENVDKALREGFDSANEVEGKFNKIVEAAKAQLGKLKGEVKSDEAKAEIDTAIENVEKATNPENVDKALREGTDSANEADKKFEKAVKDAKDALDAQNKNDPLLDDSSVTTGKENIDKATSLIAVENAKNTAVENIKKAQAEELAKAKETAKNALDDENAKDELIDNSSVTTGKQNVDNALTKAAVSSAKDTAIGNIQSAQAEELKKSKEAAKAALDEENAKDPLEDETALINAKNDIDKASTKAGVEKAKTDGISNVISAREADTICHKCGYHHSDSYFGIAFCWIVRAVRCIINLVNIIADIIS